jgi:hypothetical protein
VREKILINTPKTCITTTEIVMAIGPRILYRPQIPGMAAHTA